MRLQVQRVRLLLGRAVQCASLCLLLMVSCAPGSSSAVGSEPCLLGRSPSSGADAVFGMYVEGAEHWRASEQPFDENCALFPIFVLYADRSLVIRSDYPSTAGALMYAELSEVEFDELNGAISSTFDELFERRDNGSEFFHADSTVIEARRGDLCRRVASSHPAFEYEGSSLVCTAVGVSALEGRTRQEVMDAQPRDYRVFRQQWQLLVDSLSKYKTATLQTAAHRCQYFDQR